MLNFSTSRVGRFLRPTGMHQDLHRHRQHLIRLNSSHSQCLPEVNSDHRGTTPAAVSSQWVRCLVSLVVAECQRSRYHRSRLLSPLHRFNRSRPPRLRLLLGLRLARLHPRRLLLRHQLWRQPCLINSKLLGSSNNHLKVKLPPLQSVRRQEGSEELAVQ